MQQYSQTIRETQSILLNITNILKT